MNKCLYCEKEFKKVGRQLYCCRLCYYRHIHPPIKKICRVCKKEIPKEETHYKLYCEKCKKEHEILRSRNKDAKRKFVDLEGVLLRGAKSRAKKWNRECNIDRSDIIIPEYCPILGIKLNRNNNIVSEDSPSLDRIDSTKGYIKGNVIVISHKANSIKSYGTKEEHQKIVNWFNEIEREKQEQKELLQKHKEWFS